MLSKRQFLANAGMLATLAGCDFMNAGVTLDQVKFYTDDLVDTLAAGLAVYLQQRPSAVISGAFDDLQTARKAIDAAVTPANARQAVKDALNFLQQVTPVALQFLQPDVAAAVPIAIAVLQAFADTARPPPDAPPTPPPQLHRAAVQYRLHRH